MSEIRVAVIAEGPTDVVVINAVLNAIMPRPFILVTLQPEPTNPIFGSGWGGVLKWCHQFAIRSFQKFEDDPTLKNFDLLVIHLDADVAGFQYSHLGASWVELAKERGWVQLPFQSPCPPTDDSNNELRARVVSWASLATLGPRTVMCVPAQTSEAWVAAAVFPDGHSILVDIECESDLEKKLGQLTKAERIKKTTRSYQGQLSAIEEGWKKARARCTQADRFSRDVLAVVSA